MTAPSFLTTPQGRSIAYERLAGRGPGVVFLGGFRSDMTGTKAAHLRDWAAQSGRAFLRFDYSGHGQSSGAFEEGCIGDWLEDARAALAQTKGRQVLVGSSMGGWIALLLARAWPEKVAGLVGIAAAPDFTEDLMWQDFTAEERARLHRDGRLLRPSDYGTPDPITLRLIEDGRAHLVLREKLDLPFPLRLLQGTADVDVPQAVALRLLDHVTSPDARLTLVKGADHRFSTQECLDLITRTVAELVGPP